MNPQYADAAKIRSAQYGFQTRFNTDHAKFEDPIRILATEVPSDADTESYDWFGAVPGMTRWLADRPMGTLRANSMKIPNWPFVNGLEVNKYDILDDKLGKVKLKIAELAQMAALTPGYLLGQLLLKGHAGIASAITEVDDEMCDGTAFDGLSYFNAAHLDESGESYTFSNVGTAALAHASYVAARVVMMSYKDVSGKHSIHVRPDTLIVGPSLEATALEIVSAGNRAVGTTDTTTQIENVMKGSARVLVTDAFTGDYAAYWCLADLSKPMKPMILQTRDAPALAAADLPGNDDVFMRNKLKYGVDARWGLGYGAPQMCWGSNGTT